MHESTLLSLPPPTCIAHTGAILLRNIRPTSDPPVCMPYTIQYSAWRYRVKANFAVASVAFVQPRWPRPTAWPLQDMVLFLGLGARINSILCTCTLCFVRHPTHPASPALARNIMFPPRPPPVMQYASCNIGKGNIL